MTLYDITQQYQQVIDNLPVDSETGEILDISALLAVQDTAQNKLENMAVWVKNMNAEKAAIKAEEETLAKRRKSLERKADSVKRSISLFMQDIGMPKLSTPRAALSFRTSTETVVDEAFAAWAAANAPELIREVVATSPDKTAIKLALQEGRDIPHARLEDKQNLQIR